ncbi:MAG: hypothetical protein WAV40_00880 [Microgenomates group bacterium]
MKIDVATQRILVLKDQISESEAKQLAWDKKVNAFGAISQVTGFFSRPKDEDYELTYSEHRYAPFWHVVAKARYVYDRNASYQVPIGGSEVKSVTLHGTDYPETSGHIHIPVTEHCVQEEIDEVYVDGLSTKGDPRLAQYANYAYTVVTGQIEKIIPKGSLVVPPSARVSAIMRDSLSKMIKGIQADKILEEHVEVSTIELYYRPIYAFKYQWISKGKEGILELDGITGAITSGSRVFTEYLGKVLDQDFLFDIGADAAGMLVPGGSIAVKAARKYMSKK